MVDKKEDKRVGYVGVKRDILFLLTSARPKAIHYRAIAFRLDLPEDLVLKELDKMCGWGNVEHVRYGRYRLKKEVGSK